MTSPQKIKLTLSPEAERYVRRDAPADVRRMAARGALPLPPTELATVLFALSHDPDAEVKQTARDSLEGLPEKALIFACTSHFRSSWSGPRFSSARCSET